VVRYYSYLTIDVDRTAPRWKRELAMLRVLGLLTQGYKVRFHLTENGVHILVPDLPPEMPLRAYFGDDLWRMWSDESRERCGGYSNLLFLGKGRKVEETDDWEVAWRWLCE